MVPDLGLSRAENFHAQLFDLLCAVDDALANAGTYLLAAGTALGAVREHDLIPWDRDLDLLVPVEKYESAMASLRNNLPPQYELLGPESEGYELVFNRVALKGCPQHLVHADLFPLAGSFATRRLRLVHLAIATAVRKLFYLSVRSAQPAPSKPRTKIARRVALLVPGFYWVRLFWFLNRLVPFATSRAAGNLAGTHPADREFMPTSAFTPAAAVRVRSREFPVANSPEIYLSTLYGAYETHPNSAELEREMADFKKHLKELEAFNMRLGERPPAVN